MGDAITLKTEYQGDKRRISFALSEIALETMRNNIAHKYGLNPETVLLREKDGEAICSDSDLKQALQATKDRNEKCLKLTIVSNPSSTSFLHETSNNTAADDPTTSGTTSTDDVTDSSSSDDSDGVMQHFSTGSSQLQELEGWLACMISKANLRLFYCDNNLQSTILVTRFFISIAFRAWKINLIFNVVLKQHPII